MRLIDADAFDERVRVAGGMVEEELTDDFKDGVLATLELLKTQPTVNQWIPCSERLPDYDVEVLCYTTAHEFTVGYRMNDWGQDSWTTGAFASGTFEALAWMPLPEPYQN